VIFEHLDRRGDVRGGFLAERRWTADHGQGLDPLGPARGEGAGDGAADLGADEMKAVDLDMIHQ
jgi:hypothetical protein